MTRVALFSRKEPYINQINIYRRQGQDQEAYSLAKEFVASFKNEMVAHYLLSSVAYTLKKFEEAAEEGRKAFNLATAPDDITACATLTALAYNESGEYRKAIDLLKRTEAIKSTDLGEELLFILSLEMNNEDEALKYLDKLIALDRKAAERLMSRFLPKTGPSPVPRKTDKRK